MTMPEAVTIVEVGPRDGLQNEPRSVTAAVKIELIERLAAAGLTVIEAASFVSPKAVLQLADGAEVMTGLAAREGVRYPVLVPNMKGFDAAMAAGAKEIAIFGSPSEGFTQANINCSVADSIERFRPVCEAALARDVRVRGYISCPLGCPFEGDMDPLAVARFAVTLRDMGCFEISLGDTIGVGRPDTASAMFEAVAAEIPIGQLAAHFHDTHGRSLDNLRAVLDLGVSVIDTSVAGLGGCPFAPGASGNVATEAVVGLLDELGIESGINLDLLVDTGRFICDELGIAYT